jgi:type IV pilus assembly protein PilB
MWRRVCRAGRACEYPENVPSDLEFLGGDFTVLPVESLREMRESDSPALRQVKDVVLKMLEFPGGSFKVEPFEEYTRVRGKHKGKWHELMRFPAELHTEFTIEVNRWWCQNRELYWAHPFDGIVLLAYPNGKWDDLWVSAVRGIHGFIFQFSFCARETSFDLDLDNLGFTGNDLRALKQAVDAPAGMVLATGPTHSGKSIVCYSSVMRRLRRGDTATTIERPRKFRLPGARQILLEKYVDYTREFPRALEDDPQVLMVQDMSCFEEIQASLQAACGRLVVAAIHVEAVVPCLRRMHEFAGIDDDPRYDAKLIRDHRALLADRLGVIVSGRLLNRLCPGCRVAAEVPAATLARHGLGTASRGTALVFRRGAGCGDCSGSGLAGVTGVYEVLPVSPAMRRLLAGRAPECAFLRRAREEGLVSLREKALSLALAGTVTLEDAVGRTPPPYDHHATSCRSS